MKKQLNFLFFLVLAVPPVLMAQTTAIPDSSFERALIDLGIDSDGTMNGQVSTSDINTITSLSVIKYGITSLSGIEGFENLESLNCSNNHLSNIDVSNLSKLINFNCSSNLLTSLDVTGNEALQDLNCQNNLLDALDISANTFLLHLDCSSNRITAINTTQNIDLESLKATNNRLTSLSLEENDFLKELDCSNNQISSLNVPMNIYLTRILVASNQLTSFNTGENELLEYLDVSNNQIANLNLTNNLSLTSLLCSKNQLASLYLGENILLNYLDCSNNRLDSVDLQLNTELQKLIGSANQLVKLDVSKNLNLETINVSKNLLESMDFSSNDSLTSIDVSKNQLRTLNIQNGSNGRIDNLDATGNPGLLCILVDDMASIGSSWQKDAAGDYRVVCVSLTYVPDNNFEQVLIDLGLDSGAPDRYVPTANIDTLRHLNISGKGIVFLTGIRDFTTLDSLDCSNNNLNNLDMSHATSLTYLNCSANNLFDLNLKNISPNVLKSVNATGNPLLTCIAVEDVVDANNAPNWLKDTTAVYNTDCHGNKTYIPDNNFEQALIDLGLDYGSLDNYVVTDSIAHIKSLDVSGRNIFDLTGIEAFTNLQSLDCSSNNLSALNVSSLDSLVILICFSNYLTTLDVANNDLLTSLNCGDNSIANLDLSKNTLLRQLVCDANDLKSLDLSKNPDLVHLNCSSNDITNAGMDVSGNIFLQQLYCSNNKLTTINISNNPQLEVLDCSNNFLTALDISSDTLLKKIDCSLNKLSTLDVSNNKHLEEIECSSNQLEVLNLTNNRFLRSVTCDKNLFAGFDVTKNDSLRSMSVSGNRLTTLDLSKNLRLNYLNSSDNQLTGLGVNSNDSLVYLSISGNKISSLATGDLTLLSYLNCGNNNLGTIDVSSNKELLELHIFGNKIESLDLDSNKNIRVLNFSDNNFSSIDLMSQDSLVELNSSGNHLKSLVLNNNKILKAVNCSGNNLEALNVRNGNNDSLATFISVNNPMLFCIEVDDPDNVGANWQKDATAAYNWNCHYFDTYIPDNNFEKALAAITGQPDNNDGYILTSSIDTITSLDISGKDIQDLSGIEDFLALQNLNASNNRIDSLDLSSNTSLAALDVSSNYLSSLDLSNNLKLEELNITFNQLSVIQTDSLSLLKAVNAGFNKFTSLDFRKNPELTSLSCDSNQLASLKINNGNNSQLATLDARNNHVLACIEVDDPASANTASGWQKDNPASYSINCHYDEVYVPDSAFEQALVDAGYDDSGVGYLDQYVPKRKVLTAKSLYLKDRGIKDLTGIEAFGNLESLNIENNSISSLDFSHNTKLENILCSNNFLTGLDVANNTLLKKLAIDNNPLVSLDLQYNIALVTLSCSNTKLSKISLNQNINIAGLTATKNENLLAVDIQNGNNQNLINLNLQQNPLLNCILVDDKDAAYSFSNWLKDSTAHYRIICDDDDNDGISNADDQCPTTPPGDQVDLFGCTIYTLPADNFTVLVTDETCRSSDDGMVNITAIRTENYKATIEVDGKVREYNFTNSVEIRDVRAGTYQVCVTINGKPTFQRCFTVVISQPVDLAVIQRIIHSSQEVTLNLSGGKSYTIDLNGSILQTKEQSVTLKLNNGINRIKVETDKACQGIFEREIYFGDGLIYFPNPFKDQFVIFVGHNVLKKASINVYSFTGQLVLSTLKPANGGMVIINGSHLPAGIYTVSINTGKDQRTFKIVKK